MRKLTLLFLVILLPFATPGADTQKPNILFIAVDDLRPELGCFGNKIIKSPNIDKLASRGLVFNRAYCQQAVCSPSRTSLLTGRRPDTTKIYDLETHFRSTIPDVVTLPQYFMQNGWHSQGLSKIYHGSLDDEKSWSAPHWVPAVSPYGPAGQKFLAEKDRAAAEKGKQTKAEKKAGGKAFAFEAADCADNQLPDGATADKAISLLREFKKQDKPFFFAVGFLKPHLPFVSPKKYWDLYNEKEIQLAPNPFPPKDAPGFAGTDWGELRSYNGMPKQGAVGEEQARQLKHGYYAAVSYTDAQIGRVLDELDKLGLRDNTIVILWGDHGWQLGEHGFWCKHTNYELATHAPLIISVPGQKTAGKKTDALVEFVDIYPSLVELCGLKLPDGLEGTSFKPLLENPDRPWKKAAFSQYPRGVPGVGRIMGYTMKTDRYRFVQWADEKKNFAKYELYDHQTDPQENVNLANQPQYADKVKELSAMLKAGWKNAGPPKN
jgi:iduronate 2-sulfatase